MNLSPDILLLAAGRSRRFGGEKLHAPLGDVSILGRVLQSMSAATAAGWTRGATLVVRADDERSRTAGMASGCHCVENPEPESGLARSLQLGLAHLSAFDGPAALIMLADQPLVSVDTIAVLVQAWRRTGATCLRPRYAGEPERPGHPVLLAREAWPRAAAAKGDRGLATLFEHGDLRAVLVDVPGTNPDIDTPSDLEALRPHA